MSVVASVLQWLSVALLLFLTSCSPAITRSTLNQYDLKVTDNPAEHRFDIVLQSHDARPLCVSVENWPSRGGQLHMGSDLATLQTTAGVLPARDENFGYCPGGCGQHRVEPRGELHGFIAYEAFGDPVQLAEDVGKRLKFSVTPTYCRRK